MNEDWLSVMINRQALKWEDYFKWKFKSDAIGFKHEWFPFDAAKLDFLRRIFISIRDAGHSSLNIEFHENR
jgi:hypothetical protein